MTALYADAAIDAGIGIALALVLHLALFAMLDRATRLSALASDDLIVSRLRWPLRWLMIAIALSIAQENNAFLAWLWQSVSRFVVPALLGWTAYVLVNALTTLLGDRAEASSDPVMAASRRTRLAIFARAASFLIGMLTVALILFAIPAVHNIGITLMASAGLATLAVGAAAQPVLKSLLAGVQIAVTEPIRLGDYVVIDGQSGHVEDIRLSYVVIRSGDERRLIVPTAKFLESSFQNWSRSAGGISGSVTIPIRPETDLAPVRAAYLQRIAEHPDWDRRNAAMQVSDAMPGAIEVKLVMSAADPASLNRLRYGLLEAMVDWLRTELPEALVVDEA